MSGVATLNARLSNALKMPTTVRTIQGFKPYGVWRSSP